ncbi:conserved exported hypothetical protein [Mesorhizobium sp. ORS 3359]|nr:conserved exported hypothetical protein [Mesorhizobium sp. ORS 3359]
MSALLTIARLWLASLLCGWAFDLTPTSAYKTKLALLDALLAIANDAEAGLPRGRA